MLALKLGVDHRDKDYLVAVTEGEIAGRAKYARLGTAVRPRWRSSWKAGGSRRE